MQAAETLASILHSFQEAKFPDVEILGPAPAPLARIKQYYRWHLLLKAVDPAHIRELIRQAMEKPPSQISRGHVRVAVDMDPITVL